MGSRFAWKTVRLGGSKPFILDIRLDLHGPFHVALLIRIDKIYVKEKK